MILKVANQLCFHGCVALWGGLMDYTSHIRETRDRDAIFVSSHIYISSHKSISCILELCPGDIQLHKRPEMWRLISWRKDLQSGTLVGISTLHSQVSCICTHLVDCVAGAIPQTWTLIHFPFLWFLSGYLCSDSPTPDHCPDQKAVKAHQGSSMSNGEHCLFNISHWEVYVHIYLNWRSCHYICNWSSIWATWKVQGDIPLPKWLKHMAIT